MKEENIIVITPRPPVLQLYFQAFLDLENLSIVKPSWFQGHRENTILTLISLLVKRKHHVKRNIANDEKHLIYNIISEHKYPDNHKYNLRMIKVTADILHVPSFKSGVLLFWWCFNLVSFP